VVVIKSGQSWLNFPWEKKVYVIQCGIEGDMDDLVVKKSGLDNGILNNGSIVLPLCMIPLCVG
jgi:hypothetical protein